MRRRRITLEARGALAEMIQSARVAKGWTRPRLARAATSRLRECADDLRRAGLAPVTVTPRMIECLELATSTYPLGNSERRSRLLGIALALDLDRAEVNLIAGGI